MGCGRLGARVPPCSHPSGQQIGLCGTIRAMEPICKKLRLLSLAVVMAGLSGCVITKGALPDLTQAHGPCTDQAGGWCGFTRNIAVASWEYAQLSSNAYCDSSAVFGLPAGYTVIRRFPAQDICDLERAAALKDEDAKASLKPIRKSVSKLKSHGFNYTVYDKRNGAGKLERRVIAFRGTDANQLTDWVYGNLSNTQRNQGVELYKLERDKLDAEGGKAIPITTTGHSLGGAIAIQVSLENEGVDAYVFNTSPRYTLIQPNANKRVGVAERGDILEVLRNRSMPTRHDMMIINCRPTDGRFSAHAIRELAECLTWIAAKSDNAAKSSVASNKIIQPEGERANQDWGLPPVQVAKGEASPEKSKKAKGKEVHSLRERRANSALITAPVPKPEPVAHQPNVQPQP